MVEDVGNEDERMFNVGIGTVELVNGFSVDSYSVIVEVNFSGMNDIQKSKEENTFLLFNFLYIIAVNNL